MIQVSVETMISEFENEMNNKFVDSPHTNNSDARQRFISRFINLDPHAFIFDQSCIGERESTINVELENKIEELNNEEKEGKGSMGIIGVACFQTTLLCCTSHE